MDFNERLDNECCTFDGTQVGDVLMEAQKRIAALEARIDLAWVAYQNGDEATLERALRGKGKP